MLLIASFILNYRLNKSDIDYDDYKNKSNEYLDNPENLEKICIRHKNDFVIADIEKKQSGRYK